MAERTVTRHLREPLPPHHFLRSQLAARWQAEGRLVAYEWLDANTLSSPRLAFVSQPPEWCDAQLHAAAKFTLALQEEAVEAGFDLKDASAWNIIFDGTRPVFCDLLSFETLRGRSWWAAGQFARQFVLPLLVSQRRGLRAAECFRVWRDGIPEATSRQLLGPRRFLTRYWPLMAQASAPPASPESSDSKVTDTEQLKTFRRSLHAALNWMLKGVAPGHGNRAGGNWQTYVHSRTHYDDAAMQAKRQRVQQWLQRLQPAEVVDFGCNTGEFSRMARDTGARVIALDADHDSVQALFTSLPENSGIHPVMAPLDDLPGGRGWGGAEHPGLAARLQGRCDVALILALVHHLGVGAAIPLVEVARFARQCSRGHLIVEFIGAGDPQLQTLCAQRRRSLEEFSLDRQRAAFADAGFQTLETLTLSPVDRELVLMRVPG